MRAWRMRTGTSITVSAEDRRRLEAVVANGNSAQRHVWRCRVILMTADGLGTQAIMREAGLCKTSVCALAGALHARGRRRAFARQDAAAGQGADCGGSRRRSRPADAGRAAT